MTHPGETTYRDQRNDVSLIEKRRIAVRGKRNEYLRPLCVTA